MVSPNTKVKNLAMILIKHQISGAPVANKNGKILGIVSEADIIAKTGAFCLMLRKQVKFRQDTSLEANIAPAHDDPCYQALAGHERRPKRTTTISRADIVNAIAMG